MYIHGQHRMVSAVFSYQIVNIPFELLFLYSIRPWTNLLSNVQDQDMIIKSIPSPLALLNHQQKGWESYLQRLSLRQVTICEDIKILGRQIAS